MFLDKKSEQILSTAISKYTGNMDEDILILPNEFEIDYTELNSACKNLKQLGFFRLFIYSGFHTEPVTLRLSHNGLHYFEYKKAEKRNLWLKNAWIPTLVAFITTVITHYILPMLPMLIEWLFHTP